ncbi:hypothetical protein NQ155_05095 [Microbacterium sp. zg.B185]|nr:hypothetical protein [Microbacterium sp. zg.B185]MCR2809096.1 hypothetical protein [Microbacterium sp. zg.B185]
MRFRDDPVPYDVVNGGADLSRKQRPRVGVAEPGKWHDRNTGKDRRLAVLRIAAGDEERQSFGRHSPCREGDDLGRCAIQPLRIIDKTEQRLFLSAFRQQIQHSQTDQEPVRPRPRFASEGDGERIALGLGQLGVVLQKRRTQLMQRRICELPFRLHADHPHDPETRLFGDGTRKIQKGRLTDPRLAPGEHGAAPAGVRVSEDALESVAFHLSAEQMHRNPPSTSGEL